MISTRRVAATLALLIACTANAAAGQTGNADEVAVRAVVEGYDSALASGDSLMALSLLHANAVIYESGHAETREEYRSGHLRSDIAFASAVKRTTTADSILLSGDAALYTSEYAVSGSFRGREVDSHGTETMVLLRTPDGWKIRHIHWSSR